jgi:hypothetical protein
VRWLVVLTAAGSAIGSATLGVQQPKSALAAAASATALPDLIIPDIVGVVIMTIAARTPRTDARGRSPHATGNGLVPRIFATGRS